MIDDTKQGGARRASLGRGLSALFGEATEDFARTIGDAAPVAKCRSGGKEQDIAPRHETCRQSAFANLNRHIVGQRAAANGFQDIKRQKVIASQPFIPFGAQGS